MGTTSGWWEKFSTYALFFNYFESETGMYCNAEAPSVFGVEQDFIIPAIFDRVWTFHTFGSTFRNLSTEAPWDVVDGPFIKAASVLMACYYDFLFMENEMATDTVLTLHYHEKTAWSQ